MLAVYTATAIIPFPPYDQYFTSPMVPFLLPFVAEGLRVALLPWRALAKFCCVSLFCSFSSDLQSKLLMDINPCWHLSSYRVVGEAVKANSRPDAVAFLSWSCRRFGSGREERPGMEVSLYLSDYGHARCLER